ncbi:MAG: hypothetical protein AAFV77_09480, partial [Planctomycetota bacterium]
LNTQISRSGLTAPEAAIVNDNTALTTVENYDNVGDPDDMLPSIAGELLGLADRPEDLVDRVDVMLAFGSTHPDIKPIIVDAVASINERQPERRVRAAVALVLINPGFRHFR